MFSGTTEITDFGTKGLGLIWEQTKNMALLPRVGRKRLTMELLKRLTLVVLAILTSCKITLTLGNTKISERSLSYGPVFMVLQKIEILNQTSDSLL